MRNRKGFTLIELLIVVAIIAILAAIAVPNFLEAQTRAKVSRAKNDLRTLAVATEAYRVDNINWPFNPFYGPYPPGHGRWTMVQANSWPQEYGIWFILTTPISYITSIPQDTFWRQYNQQWGIWRDYYRIWNLENHRGRTSGWGAPGTINLANNGIHILMASVGPDKVEDCSDGDAGGGGIASSPGIWPYDPTNGTVSWGDIYYGLPGVGFDVYGKSMP